MGKETALERIFRHKSGHSMVHQAKYLLFIHSVNLYCSQISRLDDRVVNKTGKVSTHKEFNVLMGSQARYR